MRLLILLSCLALIWPTSEAFGQGNRNQPSGVASLLACTDCPPFVAVPEAPKGMRRISHVAMYELTWSQYLRSVEDGTCKFPFRSPAGIELSPAERRKFDINWTASKLRLSDVACFKAWVQRRLPPGYSVDIPTGDEWIWLAKAGSAVPAISALGAVLLESEASLGNYSKPIGLDLPQTDKTSPAFCGPVGRMPPNAWGLYDVIGQSEEITSWQRRFDDDRLKAFHFVELRGGGCLTPETKVPIDIASKGLVLRDDDSVGPRYAVRLVVFRGS